MVQLTADAARRIEVHPANLVLGLSADCGSLDQVWPELDQVAIDLYLLLQEEAAERATARGVVARAPNDATWTDAMLRVLRLLERHNHWGKSRAVKWRTLHRKYYQNGAGLKAVVDELVARGVVATADKRSTSIYWLVEERRDQIRGQIRVSRPTKAAEGLSQSEKASRSRARDAQKDILRQKLAAEPSRRMRDHYLIYCDRCGTDVTAVRTKRGSYYILWHCPDCGALLDEKEYGPADR